MYAFTFRDAVASDTRVQHQLRSVLSRRHGMRAGELSLRLGLPEQDVREHLEAMRERGEVERLRPIGYDKNDLDFYAVVRADAHAWND